MGDTLLRQGGGAAGIRGEVPRHGGADIPPLPGRRGPCDKHTRLCGRRYGRADRPPGPTAASTAGTSQSWPAPARGWTRPWRTTGIAARWRSCGSAPLPAARTAVVLILGSGVGRGHNQVRAHTRGEEPRRRRVLQLPCKPQRGQLPRRGGDELRGLRAYVQASARRRT